MRHNALFPLLLLLLLLFIRLLLILIDLFLTFLVLPDSSTHSSRPTYLRSSSHSLTHSVDLHVPPLFPLPPLQHPSPVLEPLPCGGFLESSKYRGHHVLPAAEVRVGGPPTRGGGGGG
eukprot:GHVU01005847.1.p1 GENE.GHVU01005847.1~~GHVU01005847.1.p1  ORF type:complete len:118 (-),score=13.45 GHVU01005847.1:93-446(-)